MTVVVLQQLIPQTGAICGDGVVLLGDTESSGSTSLLDVRPERAVEVVDVGARDVEEATVGELDPGPAGDALLGAELDAEEATRSSEVVVAQDEWRRTVAREARSGVRERVVVGG